MAYSPTANGVHVTDGALPPSAEGAHVAWSLGENELSFSLSREINDRAQSLKDQYLDWEASLSELEVGGVDLPAYLSLEGDMSLWWLGLIHEKSSLRSPRLVDVFKLKALEEIIESRGWEELHYWGSDYAIHECLQAFATATNRRYRWHRGVLGRVGSFTRNYLSHHRGLPHLSLAFIFLARYVLLHRGIRHIPLKSSAKTDVTFVTYFPNADRAALSAGLFRSHYVGPLHSVLEQSNLKIRWVWFYSHRGEVSAREAVEARDRCAARSSSDSFCLLQEWLNFRAILVSVLSVLRIWGRSGKLGPLRSYFQMKGSRMNFYPLLKEDLKSSLYGHAAMNGILMREMWKGFARERKTVDGGGETLFYIWENQPWELGLLDVWKSYFPGEKTIGIQHSALPSLLLRSFNRLKVYARPRFPHPLPDTLLVNGAMAKDQLEKPGYPPNRIRIAEALRYHYLNTRAPKPGVKAPTLLVTTGFLTSQAAQQIQLVAHAFRELPTGGWRVILKAHPFLNVEALLKAYPRFPIEVSTAPLAELAELATHAFVANMSTVAVEMNYLGLPVAVHVDPDDLNLSPLFMNAPVTLIYRTRELIQFLTKEISTESPRIPWFHLDADLGRWRDCLAETRPRP